MSENPTSKFVVVKRLDNVVIAGPESSTASSSTLKTLKRWLESPDSQGITGYIFEIDGECIQIGRMNDLHAIVPGQGDSWNVTNLGCTIKRVLLHPEQGSTSHSS